MSRAPHAKLYIWTELRSRSTVLLRCLSNIKNSFAFLEPYQYIAISGPSNERQSEVRINFGLVKEYNSWSRKHVKDSIENYHKTSHVIVKDIADSLGGDYSLIPENAVNIILIRHPAKCIDSLIKLTDEDIGLQSRVASIKERLHMPHYSHKAMLKLYAFLKDNNRPVAVVDSNDLAVDPEEVVKFICEYSGLPFTREMLTWESLPPDVLPSNWVIPNGYEDLRVLFNPCEVASISTNFMFKPDPETFNLSGMHPVCLEYIEETLPSYEDLLKLKQNFNQHR